MNIERLNGLHTSLGESPLWDPRTGAFVWLDCLAPCLYSMDWATRDIARYGLPKITGSIVMASHGGYAIAAEDGIYHLPALGEETRLLAPLADKFAAQSRFNDGKVDRDGRFLAGTMDLQETNPVGKAFVRDEAGLRVIDTGYVVFNGPCWSLDGTALFTSDSATGTVWRFAYDRDTGSVSGKSEFIKLSRQEGLPDGATVDSSGNFWQARNGVGCIACHGPDGGEIQKIEIPAVNVTSLAFGGPDFRHLLVTSMAKKLPWQDTLDEGSGGVFLVELDEGLSGIGEPEHIL